MYILYVILERVVKPTHLHRSLGWYTTVILTFREFLRYNEETHFNIRYNEETREMLKLLLLLAMLGISSTSSTHLDVSTT